MVSRKERTHLVCATCSQLPFDERINFTELRNHWTCHSRRAHLGHFRTHKDTEIQDYLAEGNGSEKHAARHGRPGQVPSQQEGGHLFVFFFFPKAGRGRKE